MSSVTDAANSRVDRIAYQPTAGRTTMVLWLAATVALAASAISTNIFDAMSTDDAMRLVEVRDLLGGQGWFDLVQHRLDPPGASMHWSRLVDVPLAAMILLLRTMFGQHIAEALTLILWPSLLLGAALMLVSFIATRMTEGTARNQAAFIALLFAVLSIPVLIHFRAGAIDHHNVQLVLLLGFITLSFDIETSAIRAAMAGLAAACSMAIGLEMLPIIAAVCVAIFGILIVGGTTKSSHTATFGAALAASSAALAGLLLRPQGLLNPTCDAFGGPVLLLMVGGGLSLMVVSLTDRWRPSLGLRLFTGAVAGLATLAPFFHLYPGCIGSPYANVDPLVTRLWLDQVFETMSLPTLLQLEPQKVLGFYGFPLIALVLAILMLIRCPSSARSRWIIVITAMIAALGISCWEIRGAAAAMIIAAPVVAACLAQFWPDQDTRRKLLYVGLAVSPASLALIGLAAHPLIDRLFKPQFTIAKNDNASSCQTVSSVAPIARLRTGRVMAPIDAGPAILAATDHAVFAAPYHRNNDGNVAVLRTMMAPPAVAQKILRDRNVDYVVVCPHSPNQADFEKLAPDGLAANLARGETPDFLKPLALDPSGHLAVWQVER